MAISSRLAVADIALPSSIPDQTMPFISEYPTNSLSWWFDCTKVTLDPKPDLSFKYSLLSFLATVQALDVPFLHITWEDVQQSIGLGGTARIDEAYQTLQTSLAFKRVSKKSREQSSSTAIYQILLNEVVALRHPVVQHHPHIAPLQGVCWEMGSGDDKPWPVFVFERSVDGDLYSFISSPDGRSLDTRQRLGLVMNIGLAMEALHAADIIHGDVKPQNVLVFRDESEKCEAKLIDFGFSNTLSAISDDAHHRIRLPLSAPWNAPEHDRLLREWTSTQAMETDLYSFGMLCLWVLFEPYLSGSIAVCPPRDVNYNIKPGSSIWNLGTIKHTVQAFAQDLVDLDTTLKENERVILKEFFAKSLSLNPTERDISIHDLLDGLHCKRHRSRDQGASGNYAPLTSDFEIQASIHDLILCHYRLRSCIFENLKERCNEVHNMTQLAFCYAIGFGTARNEVESRRLLGSHNINAEQLEAMKLRCLKESSYNLPDVVRKLLENSHLQQINNTSHYLRQGVIDEAERELNREYRDLVGSFGKESLLAMGAMSRLIGVYLVRKKAQEAELLIRELMGLYQNIPEGNQTGVLTCLYTLATIYSDQLRWKEAEDLYRQVIEKRTELLGESHIATLSAWNGLAVMYGSQKRWDMVEDIMQRVVSTMETTLGENHPSTMVYLGNLASAYGKRGMWEKAEEIQRLVVASSTKIQGAEHPSTLTSKANLGSALFNQGKMAEAEELLKEVIETGTKVMALEEEEARNNRYAHLDSVSIWVGNLQSMYETQGRFGESRSLAERGMEMQGLVQPAGEPRTVEELRDMILRGIEEGDQDRLGKLGGILTGWQEGLTRLLKDGFGEVEEDHVED